MIMGMYISYVYHIYVCACVLYDVPSAVYVRFARLMEYNKTCAIYVKELLSGGKPIPW